MGDLYFRVYGDYAVGGPVFYPREECPWLADVERRWETIRAEFDDYRHRGGAELKPPWIPDDVVIPGWRSINFVTCNRWYRENCARFPETVKVIRSIPNLTSAFINLLEPHSALPAHNGDTNAMYRCHLGLTVPGEVDRCGLEVAGRRVGWREGHAFAFNEAFRHRVWNDTDRDRVILVFDVLKPEYRARARRVCGGVLGAMALMAVETRVRPLRRLPVPARRILHRLLAIAASAALVTESGGHALAGAAARVARRRTAVRHAARDTPPEATRR